METEYSSVIYGLLQNPLVAPLITNLKLLRNKHEISPQIIGLLLV